VSGTTERRVERQHLLGVLGFGLLDAALDLAHVIEIVADARAVARPDFALQVSGFLGHRIENAAVLANAGLTLRGRTGPSEHPLERRPRIDLHRIRLRLRRPRDRVHVGTGVPGHAAADVAAEVLGGHFHRRELGVLADLLRDDLIDADADLDVFSLGLLRDRAAQPARGAHRVIGHGLPPARDRLPNIHLIRGNGSSGLRIGLYSKPGPVASGNQCFESPVRKVHRAESHRRLGRCLGQCGQRRDHRLEQRQRHRGAHTRRNVRRGNALLVTTCVCSAPARHLASVSCRLPPRDSETACW
jgi:hypothetical protein